MSLTKVSYSMINGECINALDYGCDNTGATDTTAAVEAAIAAATAAKTTLVFPSGTYKIVTPSNNLGLQFDLGVMSVVANGNVVFDCSTQTTSYAAQAFSSLSYPVSHYQNETHCLQGIVFNGGGVANKNGLLVGHDTYTMNCQFKIESCGFWNFDVNMYSYNNAWRVGFWNCCFMAATSDANVLFGSSTNAGESMGFFQCMIADGGAFQIDGNGLQVHLYSCSLLNTKLWVTGNSNIVNLYGGNLENPGSSLHYTYADIGPNTNNRVNINGTSITVNPATWTEPLFNVDAYNTIVFDGVTWPDINNYNIATSTGYAEFVTGDGRVLAANTSQWPLSGGVKPAVSHLCNELYNGDFETGDTAGWTVTPYGTAGSTAVASATAKKFGSYGLLATSVAGGGINVTQTKVCKPGQLVKVFAWVQLATAASSTPWNYVQIQFLSADGTVLATYGDGDTTVGTWDQLGTEASEYAPIGTANVKFILNVQPGGNVVYFDNVVMNIV